MTAFVFFLLVLHLHATARTPEPVERPAGGPDFALMGRYEKTARGSVRLFSSAARLEARFRGRQVTAILADEQRDGSSYNWVTIRIDGRAVRRLKVEGPARTYLLADSLSAGWHTLQLIRDTEGQNGFTEVVSIQAAAFRRVTVPARQPRMEFIGNSVTAAMGALTTPVACGTGAWFDQHLASEGFASLTAEALGARFILTAVSGIGVYRNWNSPGPVMPDVYTVRTTGYNRGENWDFSLFQPDLIVIGLGTNDYSEGAGPEPREPFDAAAYERAYTAFLDVVAKHNPGAGFLLVTSPMLEPEKNAVLESALNRVAGAFRQARPGRSVAVYRWKTRYNSGCTGHPDVREHRQMANELIPVVAALTGWKAAPAR